MAHIASLRTGTGLAVLAVAVWIAPAALAQSPDTYYAGRTIKLAIGAAPGGTYDALSRLLAPHLRRHLAGNPVVVTENMPGASGVRAAIHIAQTAPRDGTAIALLNQQLPSRQVLEPDQVKVDMRALGWIGAMGKSTFVTFTWHESGVRTLDDARRREVVVGAQSDGGGTAMWPLLYNKFLGTRFKVVTGYPGVSAIMLAMERREVDGQGNFPWIGVKGGWPSWVAERKITNLVQLGLEKDPELGDVPLVLDLVKSPLEKALFTFLAAQTAMIAPLATPPGTPPERLAQLRKAFLAATSDAEFRAEAATRNQPVAITGGEEVARIVDGIVNTAPDVIAAMRAALAEARDQVSTKGP